MSYSRRGFFAILSSGIVITAGSRLARAGTVRAKLTGTVAGFSSGVSGHLFGLGSGYNGRTGYGGNKTTWEPISATDGVNEAWAAVSAGSSFGYALRNDGTLWGIGYGGADVLGGRTDLEEWTQITAPDGVDSQWKAVSCGDYTCYALREDGTSWGIGRNHGNMFGPEASVSVWTQIVSSDANDASWIAISGGYQHAYGLRSDGTLWGVGADSGYGNLSGAARDKWHQILAPDGVDEDWISVAAGRDHGLALRADGTTWAIGRGHFGQNGTWANSSQLIQISAVDGVDAAWTAISTYHHTNYAVRSDGTLWGCGLSSDYEIGVASDRHQWTQILSADGNDSSWIDVSAGEKFAYALRSDGTVWGIGRNWYSCLGANGSPVTVLTQLVSSDGQNTGWRKIAAGSFHGYALR